MRDRIRTYLPAVLVACGLFVACGANLGLEEHVLNRIGYGPDAWSKARIRAIGAMAYIQEQLQPATLNDAALELEIAIRYPLTTWSLPQLRSTYNEYNDPSTMKLPGQVRQEMAAARMLRNVHSKKQLEQVLVDFWHNHFNVNAQVATARWGVVTYEREALRPYVLGRFRDMLRAVAKHPSMVCYLDNDKNFINGYVRGTQVFGINENYARELLELHTLGVDAGYTLHDIQEVARAFTGWTINSYQLDGTFNYFEDRFQYEDAGHDKGAKSIMALYIPSGGGMSDGEAVLDYLARHPITARFISYKLVQRFVSETPPPMLVDRAANRFLATDGDLREVMRTILTSQEFLGQTYRRQKIKRPQHFVASLARAVGVVDNGAFAWRSWSDVGLMGEDLYWAAPPTGYPETSAYWRGEATFLLRTNVAIWASYGLYGFGPAVTSPFTSTPSQLSLDLARRMVHGGVSATTLLRLSDLGSRLPEYARAPEVAAVVLATPDFLVH